MAKAYYNEFDPGAAAWLRELIRRDLIAPGDVDNRSIVDVRPDDLRGYTQVHCFAGIGVWSYALRQAGWSDDRPVWTGSPPCQPFSAAGKGLGTADERHLWPAFFHLIDICRPDTFFGEQVASKDALDWLDHVFLDVEGAGYAFGAFDLCAAGFGAPHIRQRLKFVGTRRMGDSKYVRQRTSVGREVDGSSDQGSGQRLFQSQGSDSFPVGLALPDDAFWRANLSRGDFDDGTDAGRSQGAGDIGPSDTIGGVANAASEQCDPRRIGTESDEFGEIVGSARFGSFVGTTDEQISAPFSSGTRRPSPTNGFWGDVDWLFCRDGKWRPVEPGTFPLAHGSAARVGRLRGYGNAIVAPAAAAFIATFLESEAAGHVALRTAGLEDLLG